MFRNLCNLLPPRNENDTFSSQVLNLAQYPPKIWQMGGFVLQMGKSECKPPRSLSIATCLLMPDANAWSWQRIYMHVSQPAPFGSHSRTQKNQDVLFRSFQSNDWLMVGLVEALGKNFLQTTWIQVLGGVGRRPSCTEQLSKPFHSSACETNTAKFALLNACI
jgi:hypothetical protein